MLLNWLPVSSVIGIHIYWMYSFRQILNSVYKVLSDRFQFPWIVRATENLGGIDFFCEHDLNYALEYVPTQ